MAACRAEAKRQGLLLTGKAKKEADRLAAVREAMLKNAGAAPVGVMVYVCPARLPRGTTRAAGRSCLIAAVLPQPGAKGHPLPASHQQV